jgi:uncharacterized membrane protein YccC
MIVKKYLNQIYAFDFLKGLVLTFCLALPLYLAVQYDNISYGLPFALGVFFTFLPNTNGSNKHRIYAILFSLGLALLITVLSYFTRTVSNWLYLVFFALSIFSVSMLSVYGFRASMVAFSGHLALIMSFALLKNDLAIEIQLAMILCGGLWYLLWASLSHYFLQNKTAIQNLALCVENTADFLKIRHQLLWNDNENNFELEQKLIKSQISLTESHELLRELLFYKRREEGQSNKTNRLLLIFLEMLEVYEISLGINTDPTILKEALVNEEFNKLKAFSDLSAKMVVHLYALSESLKSGQELLINNEDEVDLFEQCEVAIENYVSAIGLPQARSGALLLRNLQDYQKKQWQKVFAAKRVYANILEGSEAPLKRSDRKLFITTQDYSFKILKNNLSPKSVTFRHALRLTVAMLVGLLAGRFIEHQNAYWILLTVAVILRPNFGLTKARALHRIYGTLAGTAFSVLALLIFSQKWIYGTLAVPSFFIGALFLQKNYKVAATFITSAVILLYGVLVENALTLVQYRVFDTLIGAAISFLAIYFLWPAWEENNIKNSVRKALKSDINYLKEIDRLYIQKTIADTAYRLARKKALIENSNLMASFQRQLEEPKSQQEHAAQIYAAVVLNQTFITALAAFSTFIQNHETTEASDEYKVLTKAILGNLKEANGKLTGVKAKTPVLEINLENATQVLENKYKVLEESRNYELKEGFKPLSPELRNKLQEAKMVTDHLKWLYGLTENMKETAQFLV